MTIESKPARRYKAIKPLPPGGCLERLIALFGGSGEALPKIARLIGLLSYRNVYNWTKNGYIPAKWGAHVELISEGAITALQVVEEAAIIIAGRKVKAPAA